MSQRLTLQPGPEDGVDAPIASGTNANTNLGDITAYLLGNTTQSKGTVLHRLLIHFDLSSIPADAVVVSAVFMLESALASFVGTVNFHVYRCLRNDWTELGATWNLYDGVHPWTTPGGDYSSDDSASIAITPGATQLVFAVSRLATDALCLRDGSLDLLFIGPEGSSTQYCNILTSDNSTVERRPKLVVDYVRRPRLTIVDRQDGSGATAHLTEVEDGDTCTIWVRSFAGDLTGGDPEDPPLDSNPWIVAGSRSGSGEVEIDLDPGHYFAYASTHSDTVEVPSVINYFVVTDGLESIHTRCLDAVQARIRLLGLTDLSDEQVIIEKFPLGRSLPSGVGFPAIVISPARTTMPNADGTNGADDVRYDVLVALFDQDNQEPTLIEGLERHLLWRQQIARAFRNQRLPGVPEVINCEVDPDDGLDEKSWRRELMTSVLRVRFTSRETRGF